MCSRYEIIARPQTIKKRFRLACDPAAYESGVRSPTDAVLIVGQGQQNASLAHWGFKTDWDDKPLVNARLETLEERRSFRPHLNNRCLIPASAYFEWRASGRSKIKNRIFLSEEPVMAFAGLLNDKGAAIIITTNAAPGVAHIHHRMPLILDTQSEAHWQNPNMEFGELRGDLRPKSPCDLRVEEIIPKGFQADLFG